MKATAAVKFVRMSPRKVRLVANTVRGKDPHAALVQLRFMRQRAAEPLTKVLKQVIANASQAGINGPLLISKLLVDEGPVYKRWRAVSRGQAHSIQKYTSHIKVEVTSKQSAAPVATRALKTAKAQVESTLAGDSVADEQVAVQPAEKKAVKKTTAVKTKKSTTAKATTKRNTK